MQDVILEKDTEKGRMAMAKIRKKSVVPVYSVAVVWIFWASCMPMYKISHFVWLILWSFIIYKLTGVIWRGKWVEAEEPTSVYVPTGDTELDSLLLQGKDAIQQMKMLNAKIKNRKMCEKVERLISLSKDIFEHVAKNPEKGTKIRKFMNYYLPTTLKLLESYVEAASQSVRGKNITATMVRIEAIMSTIVIAFEKQLDSLFSANALDISADIMVLEEMLRREGLTETPVHRQDLL